MFAGGAFGGVDPVGVPAGPLCKPSVNRCLVPTTGTAHRALADQHPHVRRPLVDGVARRRRGWWRRFGDSRSRAGGRHAGSRGRSGRFRLSLTGENRRWLAMNGVPCPGLDRGFCVAIVVPLGGWIGAGRALPRLPRVVALLVLAVGDELPPAGGDKPTKQCDGASRHLAAAPRRREEPNGVARTVAERAASTRRR